MFIQDHCPFCKKTKDLGKVSLTYTKTGGQYVLPILMCEQCGRVTKKMPEEYLKEFIKQIDLYFMLRRIEAERKNHHA